MKIGVKSGATLAAAAAALILAGAVSAPTASAQGGEGKCVGANACKGQSACKTAKSSCKGHNACKGQGFTMSSQEACAKAKGKFEKV
ncbi:MAG: hypothetical protein AB7V13_06070 [Pseudorhodoplanes sp.]|uniref:BufA2 family periplasmic bufferin-type metallophore n=1 Tax=Pseudorhodoplanes sp. TaxID=1934341 RepID=UPI003D0C02A3